MQVAISGQQALLYIRVLNFFVAVVVGTNYLAPDPTDFADRAVEERAGEPGRVAAPRLEAVSLKRDESFMIFTALRFRSSAEFNVPSALEASSLARQGCNNCASGKLSKQNMRPGRRPR